MGRSSSSAVDHLLAARNTLCTVLSSSFSLSSSLSSPSPRLASLSHRLPLLSSSIRPALASRETLAIAPAHIARAISPAAAVLKVFDAIHGLEPALLSNPRDDLQAYLTLVKRLEEALRFLANNCDLAVKWLDDVVDYLGANSVGDQSYIAHIKNSILAITETRANPLDGGLLDEALDRLEVEFHRLLIEHSVPLPMSELTGQIQAPAIAIASSPLPVRVIQKLLAILERLKANDRTTRCVEIYVEVRGANVKESLRSLGLDYLDMSNSEFSDVQSVEKYIVMWGKHLEFAVKHLFEAEYKLCSDVFDRFGPRELWTGAFADIASQAGIQAFLRFGQTVAESRKDPIKLLKLLDIFACLNNLRLDFNRLFGGKACTKIQNLTRDLIKRVVDGACEIFGELLVQVELQRPTAPPPDGGIPKIVTFMTDYCNRLLGEEYMPVLKQVLTIHQNWKRERFHERLLTDSIRAIVQALEQNLDTWSKHYSDAALSCVFMMNTHWHFHKHLRGTKLGDLMGEPWLKEHEQFKDYYAAIYMRESWGKLPPLLSKEGLIFLSGGRTTARDLVKKRLKAFNEAFDETYKAQSRWVVSDNELREKTCQLVVQAIVPVYRSYMQNYGPLVEQEASGGKYVKHTVQSMETMLGSLFQYKLGRSVSIAARHSNGKTSDAAMMTSKHRPAPTSGTEL